MGRSISGHTAGAGAGSAISMGYTPTRLYAPPGAGGGNYGKGGSNDLIISPFLLRPGLHRVKGLWLAIGTAGTACRLGLWADNGSGGAGELLKDCGQAEAVPQGLLKALFTPFELDGGVHGRMIHFGASFGTARPIICHPHSGSTSAATAGASLADIGLPSDAVGNISQGLYYSLSQGQAEVLPSAPLTSAPAVSAPGGGDGMGMLVGGLIFG